jgi:hypothetical protein
MAEPKARSALFTRRATCGRQPENLSPANNQASRRFDQVARVSIRTHPERPAPSGDNEGPASPQFSTFPVADLLVSGVVKVGPVDSDGLPAYTPVGFMSAGAAG